MYICTYTCMYIWIHTKKMQLDLCYIILMYQNYSQPQMLQHACKFNLLKHLRNAPEERCVWGGYPAGYTHDGAAH